MYQQIFSNPVQNALVEPCKISHEIDFSFYEEGETKYKDNFGPAGDIGCFGMIVNIHNVRRIRMMTKGMIVMFFVNKKVEKINKNRKSLISRNRGFKTELKKSVR